MTDMTAHPAAGQYAARGGSWPRRAEAWLDARGRGAWIAAMVAGFIAFWPIGLALVLFMSLKGKWTLDRQHAGGWRRGAMAMRSSGNSAFDAYKADTLRRLEDEQEAFESFLERLRAAKDKAEFDQFMDDRARSAKRADEPGSDG